MALRTQTLNRGNIVTPICQYWPLAASWVLPARLVAGGEMPIVVVVVGQGGDLLLLIITNVSSYSTAYVQENYKEHFLLYK